MNRLEYWLRAKTQYNLHSPYIFKLYNEVLFAHLDAATITRLGGGREALYRQMVYKLSRYYPAAQVQDCEGGTLLQGVNSDGDILIFPQPHHNAAAELRWNNLRGSDPWRVCVDMYDVGLLFSSRRLHPQYFMLRDGIFC